MDIKKLTTDELSNLTKQINEELSRRTDAIKKIEYEDKLSYVGKCFKSKVSLLNNKYKYTIIISPNETNPERMNIFEFVYPLSHITLPTGEIVLNELHTRDEGFFCRHPLSNKLVIDFWKDREINQEEFFAAYDKFCNDLKKILKNKAFIQRMDVKNVGSLSQKTNTQETNEREIL